jgi:hypothetical protein
MLKPVPKVESVRERVFVSPEGNHVRVYQGKDGDCYYENEHGDSFISRVLAAKILSMYDERDEMIEALKACRAVINATNEAHQPGTAIPGFDDALSAVLAADSALQKAGVR